MGQPEERSSWAPRIVQEEAQDVSVRAVGPLHRPADRRVSSRIYACIFGNKNKILITWNVFMIYSVF